MDPLSGLSVAAAVVQFVDFGCRVLSSAYEIKHSTGGTVSGYRDIGVTTNSLVKLSKSLNESLIQGKSGRNLTANDIEIGKIAHECSLVGSKLLKVLDNRTVSNPGKWESFRLALVSQWGVDEVDSLENQLLRFKQDLVPLLLGSLRYF